MDSFMLVAKYHGARNVVVESEALTASDLLKTMVMPSNFFQMVREPLESEKVSVRERKYRLPALV
jgi:hypothetical protein